MPSRISDDQLGQAVLQSVQDGRFPEEEAVITAKLQTAAFAGLSELLEVAQDEVKVCPTR